jgi:hypothetical protein
MDLLKDNSGRTWIKIASERAVPDYVLNYVPITEKDAAALDSELFADPVHRVFPMHDAPSTWLSAAYFRENSGKINSPHLRKYAADALRDASVVHGVEADVAAVLDSPSEKRAAAATMGERSGLPYPVHTRDDVKTACDHFNKHLGMFTPPIRKNMAAELVKTARAFGAEPPRFLFLEAGMAAPNRVAIMETLLERAGMAKCAGSAAAVAAMAEMVAVADQEDLSDAMDKIAEVLDAVDNAAGARSHYGVRLMSPMQAMGGMTAKEAADMLADVVDMGGLPFSASKLSSLGAGFFRGAMGPDFLDAVMEKGAIDSSLLKDVIDTLPDPDKLALREAVVRAVEGRG